MWEGTVSRNFSYAVSVTSSCPTGNMIVSGITGTQFTLNNLCPHTNYTVAVRTVDMEIDKKSIFSDIYGFSTSFGQPTAPRFVTGLFDEVKKEIIITWIIPTEPNGELDKYEIQWTVTGTQCTEKRDDVIANETENAATFEFINRTDVEVKLLLVCVRAINTDGNAGTWGMNSKSVGTQLPLQTMDDCNSLTIVASVAAFTVASSLIMSIILLISVVQKGWFCMKDKVNGGYPTK